MNTRKIITSIAIVAVVVGAVFVGKSLGGSSTGKSTGLLIVPRQVERRSLEDVLTVSGEIRRDETKKINSPVDGQVSDVAVSDGDTVNAGDTIFLLMDATPSPSKESSRSIGRLMLAPWGQTSNNLKIFLFRPELVSRNLTSCIPKKLALL